MTRATLGHPPDGDPAHPGGTWPLLRPLVLRIHFWAGVLVGPFLLVAAVTGLLYTLTPQLEPIVYREQLTVPPAPTSTTLAAQVRIAEAALPDAELTSVRPGAGPTDTTQVIFAAPDLGASMSRTAFVDPHTAAPRGVLPTYGSGQALPLRTWVDQLHRNLHLGEPGRLYTELAASWLWVLVLGGLVLWLGRHRRRRRAAALLRPRLSGGRRARLLSWHAVVGLWAAVGLLFLSATGLTWSTYAGANVTALRAQLSWETPSPSTTLPGAADPPAGATGTGGMVGMPGMAGMPGMGGSGGTGAPVDAAAFDVAATAAARAGVGGPVEIEPPSAPARAATVTQIQRQWPQKLDAISVDTSTGRVVDTVRAADWPLAAKLARWGIDAHMGLLFGLANQIVLSVLAAGLTCMVVWASVLWWRRGPGQRAGTTPAAGALRGLPRPVLVGVLVVTVAVGVLLPLVGAGLLVFLLLETLVDRRHRVGAHAREASVASGSPAARR